jgi:hypothetical protein
MSIFEKQKGNKKENPSRLLIIAHKGVGKTTILEGLPNAVILDLEDRSSHITATVANLKKKAVMEGKPLLQLYGESIAELRQLKKSGTKIDYIVLETLSSFEKLVRQKATENFIKSTLIGQKMADKKTVRDVTAELPNGAGWQFFFNAYQDLIEALEGVADKAIIYTAHIKQRSIIKGDKEVLGEDIDFPGKSGIDLMKNCQACGILQIDEQDPYKRILDFSHAGRHMLTKASSSHLHNKKIVISEQKDGKLTTHWDKVFPGWIK